MLWSRGLVVLFTEAVSVDLGRSVTTHNGFKLQKRPRRSLNSVGMRLYSLLRSKSFTIHKLQMASWI